MPGGRDPVGGGVRATDNRRGNLLPGVIEVTVECRECGLEMAAIYLTGNGISQHGQTAVERQR